MLKSILTSIIIITLFILCNFNINLPEVFFLQLKDIKDNIKDILNYQITILSIGISLGALLISLIQTFNIGERSLIALVIRKIYFMPFVTFNITSVLLILFVFYWIPTTENENLQLVHKTSYDFLQRAYILFGYLLGASAIFLIIILSKIIKYSNKSNLLILYINEIKRLSK
jgi:hypothetical protein